MYIYLPQPALLHSGMAYSGALLTKAVLMFRWFSLQPCLSVCLSFHKPETTVYSRYARLFRESADCLATPVSVVLHRIADNSFILVKRLFPGSFSELWFRSNGHTKPRVLVLPLGKMF